ncbi:radical SAM protein [Neglectibacter sp. X58]|uniref:radical SAM protein n=1 Tax=unclassified Neglectibacter TaxID=2632164 RepID=UPI00325BB91D
MSYEGSYLNALKCMDYFCIPKKRVDRGQGFPILIAGGVPIMYNPLPLVDFFDVFVLGEGEDCIHEILDVYLNLKGLPKKVILEGLSRVRGVFVPSIHNTSTDQISQTSPVNISNRPAYSIFLSKYTVYEEETFTIEVRRGCNQKCRFCYMGTRLRPARTVSYEAFKEVVQTGLSYCNIIKCFYEGLPTETVEQYLSYIQNSGGRLRIGSQRLEMLSEKIIEMMAAAGQRKLVIAPESSERLRKVIGKERITNSEIIKYMDIASEKGIKDVGLYFIIGLPGETKEDLDEIASIINLVRRHMDALGNESGFLEVGINPLFPKPFTAFQYVGATTPEIASEKLMHILKNIQKNYPVHISNDVVDEKVEKREMKESDKSVIKIETTIGSAITFSQPILSRGDQRLGEVLIDMYKKEDTEENWRKALLENDILFSDFFRPFLPSERLLWDFQKCFVSKEHLASEYNLALKFLPTTTCDANCSRCKSRCLTNGVSI